MSALSYQNKVVVITGGSSGIGLALAKEFAAKNAHLVLIGRDARKLHAAQLLLEDASAKNMHVQIIAADVSCKEEIHSAINQVGKKYGHIDVLINCAGIITCGRFTDQPAEDLEKCMQINYFGSMYASKAAWPYLKKTKGQLSFVSSVAGYMGLFGYSSYAPPKFALMGLAECLRMEGKDDGINVSIIYPPDADTPLLQYEHAHTLPECRALSANIKVKTAEYVAKKYLAGLLQNKFEIYCDTDSKMLRWFKNNFPRMADYFTWRIINKARRNK